MLQTYDLRCSYRKNPVGLDERRPEFSWKIQSDQNGVMQTQYQVQVAEDESFADPLWDSGSVASDESAHVAYAGPELKSTTRYFWRVRIGAGAAGTAAWNGAFFETAFFSPDEWTAEFISADQEERPAYSAAAPCFRKGFTVTGDVAYARAYATAQGLYELRLNGEKVGDCFLTPGWTSYHKRLQYQTYDVTAQIRQGENAVGALLGNGWFKGPLAGWEKDARGKYGMRTSLLAEIRIVYRDGRRQTVATDGTWKTSPGAILKSEIYDGEIYDAAKEQPGWDLPGFDDRGWTGAHPVTADKRILTAQENIPVKAQETIRPVSLFRTPKGETVLDFGQNMVGWVRFRVSGPRGSRVLLHHAEILDKDGNLYTENLRSAKETVDYRLKGEGVETFEPHFTYQGFRYVHVAEYPGKVKMEDFEGVVLHSGMAKTGGFRCSDDLVNKLQHNILWGQKGNFVDVPTDCPQRDERLGWTGDAQVFARTACFNMDTALFFKKWLRDLEADQLPNGSVAHVVPQVLDPNSYGSTGWGDAAVICPWQVFLCFGDRKVLAEQYASMKKWVEYIRGRAHGNMWDTGFHFGDWLALDRVHAADDNCFGATPNDYTATAFYAHSASLLAKAAAALGKEDEAEEYAALERDIVKSFRREYFTPTGRLAVHTQTAHVLALMFGLVEERHRKRTVDSLLALLKENGWHLDTGFLGTPYLCHVLSRNGHPEAAYRLLLQKDYPSWLYQVTKGATTVWEHWDGLKPDGTFWSPGMNSFNHYAYGSIGSWLYQTVAGIDIDEKRPGYKHIVLHPTPGDSLDWAQASHETPYGRVSSRWERKGGALAYSAEIPHNTTATVILPAASCESVTVGGKAAEPAARTDENGRIVFECGSGHWEFHCAAAK